MKSDRTLDSGSKNSLMLQETRKRNKPGFQTPTQLFDDLINEIINHLPAKSNFRFKCVSKQWFSLNSEALKLKSETLSMSGIFYTTQKGKGNRFVEYARTQEGGRKEDSCVDGTLGFLPEHLNVRIKSSCGGLVLMEGWDKHGHSVHLSDQTSCLYVCNPATRKWVKIPCDYTKAPFHVIKLDFNPRVSVHFSVIMIRSRGSPLHEYTFEVFSSKTGEWKISKVTNPMLSQYGLYSFSTSIFEGLIFCTDHENTHVAGFDVEGNHRRRIELPGSSHEKDGCFLCHLGRSGGSLFQVGGYLHYYYITEGRMLYVWKLAGYETGSWVLRNSFRVAGPLRRIRDLEFHSDTDEVFFVRIKDRLHSYNIPTAQMVEFCPFYAPFLYFPYSPCYLEGLGNE